MRKLFSKITNKIFLHYSNKRPYYWFMVFIAPVLFLSAIFLWHIEARNMKVRCLPEKTWLACFDGNQDYFVLKGILNINFSLYLPVFFIFLGAILTIEILAKIHERMRK